jgi:hypothetical protein
MLLEHLTSLRFAAGVALGSLAVFVRACLVDAYPSGKTD